MALGTVSPIHRDYTAAQKNRDRKKNPQGHFVYRINFVTRVTRLSGSCDNVTTMGIVTPRGKFLVGILCSQKKGGHFIS